MNFPIDNDRLVTVFVLLLITPFVLTIYHALKNKELSKWEKGCWLFLIIFTNILGWIIYWINYYSQKYKI